MHEENVKENDIVIVVSRVYHVDVEWKFYEFETPEFKDVKCPNCDHNIFRRVGNTFPECPFVCDRCLQRITIKKVKVKLC